MKIRQSVNSTNTTEIRYLFQNSKETIQDFTGKPSDITVRYEDSKTVIYCGLGDKTICSGSEIRAASAKGIQKAIELKREKVSVIIPQNTASEEPSRAVIEGIMLGAYRFSIYKSEKPAEISLVELVGSTLGQAELKALVALCESVMYARDLVNENASVVNPDYLAKEALKFESVPGFRVKVLNSKELQNKKLNLISLVGQASSTPPCLIIIEYTGNSRTDEKTAVVGKGITFDSGGQNHKPTGSIETMRSDMAGAAAVLGIMKVLSLTKPKINVAGVIPAAHNAIGGNAYFPGDIYRSYSGKTVEILSTDAEGRLVLADAISYCQVVCRPTRLIDLATLTGGVLSALGDFVAALFSNSDRLAADLFRAGEKTGERLWRLPLYKEYCDSIKSDIGDIRNVSKLKKGHASSITGAAFIKEFINEGVSWAHIDIAGTAFLESQSRGEIPANGTGYGVRLIMEYLLSDHKK